MKRGSGWQNVGYAATVSVAVSAAVYAVAGQTQVASTLLDFFQPGSQPNAGVTYASFASSRSCKGCHEVTDISDMEIPIYPRWHGSMMAQSARDPLFYACLAVANRDAAFAGDLCIRCHAPGGWISGRSVPTDGSALTSLDRDGVSCSVCHRMVDPVFKPGESPYIDQFILAQIDPLPISPAGGNYILDPLDDTGSEVYRGPFDDAAPLSHVSEYSPFHLSPEICATCHDVSNPMYVRNGAQYQLSLLGEAHPTGDKYDMFPLERTYSEWLHSDFAREGVDMGGRFGGSLSVISTCQDCHMPLTEGPACRFEQMVPYRMELAAHDFAGGNAWVQDMVWNLYPGDHNRDLYWNYLQDGKDRAVSMLQRASTLNVSQAGNRIIVRITNETGHKLPTGYPEGRRMWINVKFYDQALNVIREHGLYDPDTALLATSDTKVYEAELGVDAAVAAMTGIPEGKGFHFALNNVIYRDNRIPPRGYAFDLFTTVQAGPVGATYFNSQYWDETEFRIPEGAVSASVSVYYQTASREYITFLRDENAVMGPGNPGDVLYTQWELTGKSPPVLMSSAPLLIQPFASGDLDKDLVVGLTDLAGLVTDCMTAPDEPYVFTECQSVDFDSDNDVDFRDFAELQLLLEQ